MRSAVGWLLLGLAVAAAGTFAVALGAWDDTFPFWAYGALLWCAIGSLLAAGVVAALGRERALGLLVLVVVVVAGLGWAAAWWGPAARLVGWLWGLWYALVVS